MIGALLELLEYDASNPDEQTKFKDLTVKCLIKVTKSLDEDIKTDRTTRALITVSTRSVRPASRSVHIQASRSIHILRRSMSGAPSTIEAM